MPNKYYGKKITAIEFKQMLEDADVTPTEFQMLTGKHRRNVVEFMNKDDREQHPSISDLLILKYLIENPEAFEPMIEIAKSFITGDSDHK